MDTDCITGPFRDDSFRKSSVSRSGTVEGGGCGKTKLELEPTVKIKTQGLREDSEDRPVREESHPTPTEEDCLVNLL